MGIDPENTGPRIAWYRSRLAEWADHAAEIGLPPEDVALLEARVADAADKLMRQRLAQNAARAATAELRGAMESLSRLGASMIGKIRSAARMEGDGVYAKALMSPPAEPSPIGAPGTPTGFRALLQSDGVMLLK